MSEIEEIRKRYPPYCFYMEDKYPVVDCPVHGIGAYVDLQYLLSEVTRLQKKTKELEIQLEAVDEGLLKASDPNNPWKGIHAECKGWKKRAEKAETRVKELEEGIEKHGREKYDPAYTGRVPDFFDEELYKLLKKGG